MAASMATMAILNTKCMKSTLINNNTPKPKPISLLSIIPKGLISSTRNTKIEPAISAATSTATATALAGAFFAGLGSCEPAMAAQQLAQIAEGSDNRGLALLLPLIPAIAWVLYNILQPALNQINRMRSEKAVVVGLGLGGLMWAAAPGPSQAAVDMATVAAAAAADDNRGTLLLIVILPAIGWVLYNILQPALNQLNRMRSD